MCGIAGYIGKKELSEDSVKKTLSLMKNRGPDYQSFEKYHLGEHLNVYFLHSRLSIIDLDERAHQPFHAGDCSIIYNGEIYNYVEIKETLEKQGDVFFTSSDTEVLLRSYIRYGKDCVTQFNGMWSFAIFDHKKEELFFSRDRFAEKPLYYYQDDNGLYFGSEIKFIQSLLLKKLKVNQRHLLRYLVNGYKALYKTGETYFEGIKELSYASSMVVGADLKPRINRYWQPQFSVKEMSVDDAIKISREKLFDSLKIRLRADVPLAFCLSGGVDSSGLASIAKKIFNYDVAAFSIIDSDERYNELDNIQATVNDLKCPVEYIQLNYDNSLQKLEELIRYHDAPIATITYFVHSFLSKAISEKGYRVSVSGTAADELFTGYYDHFNLHLYEMRNHPDFAQYLKDWEEHTGTFIRNPLLQNPKMYFDNPQERAHIYMNNDIFADYLLNGFKEQFREEHFTDRLLRNRMLNELFHEATPLILHEDDLNSMKYSVENRSPYLDVNLFEAAYSIPEEYLIHNGYGKNILRESLKSVLNDTVRLDRKKKGFNASITSVVNFKDKTTLDYLLSDSPIYDIVDRGKIADMLRRNYFENSFSKFLFSFINAKTFLEINQ